MEESLLIILNDGFIFIQTGQTALVIDLVLIQLCLDVFS